MVLLFGVFQAMLFLAGMWKKGPKTLSFWLLVVLLINISIILLHHGLYISMPAKWPIRYAFLGFSTAAWMAVPPAFYLYARSLLVADFQWRPIYWFYFTYSFYQLFNWLFTITGYHWGFYIFFREYPDLYLYLWVGSYLLLALVFGLAVMRLPGFASNRRFQWLKYYTLLFLLAISMAGMILIWLGFYDRYSENFELSILIVFELFALLLAFQSIRRSAYPGQLANRLYGTISSNDRVFKARFARLEAYMQETRPYLRSDLRLSDLADGSGISENALSQLFSQHLKLNFYDYINRYRLAAFEAGLQQSATEQLTISGLAQECGFKSKTSLYKVFRAKYGTTPAAYIKAATMP